MITTMWVRSKTSATTPSKLQPPAATHSQFSQPLQRLPNDILSLPSDSTIVYKDEKFNDDNTIVATPNNGLRILMEKIWEMNFWKNKQKRKRRRIATQN